MKTKLIQWREGDSSSALKCAVAGDFCPREANSDDTAERANEITAEVKPYFEDASLRILQWECTATRQDTPIIKSGPNHRCYPPAAAFAQALNIDAVLLANNHTGDYGPEGVKDTLETFRDLSIATLGAGMDQAEAEKPFLTVCNGIRIAVINAAEHEFGFACGKRPGAAALDVIRISNEIRALKKECDIVLVTLHGGHEHYGFPTPRLRQMCRFFVDCGADGVFNCHSHCPVGYEVYQSSPIVYSPGNFYFPPRPTSDGAWFIGYVPKFYFDRKGAFALEILPYFNYKSRIALMDEEDTANFFAYMDELCAPIGDEALLQKYFDGWSVHNMNGYLETLCAVPESKEYSGADNIRPWMALRNFFSCEAHHDLMRNLLYLLELDQLEQASACVEELLRFQNPPWVKKEF